ncbi:MAG: hypothetical protein QHJ82_15100 [Verrucomicrobiota bacterium]|nr:hypothetical protein [Verrucomicrobiota bacterium]
MRSGWAGTVCYLYVESGSSAAKYVNAIDAAGFGGWSISYNKWTQKLERLAGELPESAWSGGCGGGAGSNDVIEQYAWLRHQPGDCARAHVFAVVRRREPEELFYKYGFAMFELVDSFAPD